jgi:ATP-GRASP peptide maturase of grasp-with-spasm system
MIIVFSKRDDSTTTNVLHWLKYFNEEFVRLNSNDEIKLKYLRLDNHKTDIKCSIGNKSFAISDVKHFWYRSGGVRINGMQNVDKVSPFYKFLNREMEEIETFFHNVLESKCGINKLSDANIHKLKVLNTASGTGLIIPKTVITNSKKELQNFFKSLKTKSVITKAIWNSFAYNFGEDLYVWQTTQINIEKMSNKIPAKFFPSLFQEELDKKYELRIFYLDGRFFPSVIFSQNDPQTKVDFRNYNRTKPNRVNPFHLPKLVEKKIYILMKRLGINSGSIDMVYTKDGRFVFLEVNPVGQFAQVSMPCNYFLEREIAYELSNAKTIQL